MFAAMILGDNRALHVALSTRDPKHPYACIYDSDQARRPELDRSYRKLLQFEELPADYKPPKGVVRVTLLRHFSAKGPPRNSYPRELLILPEGAEVVETPGPDVHDLFGNGEYCFRVPPKPVVPVKTREMELVEDVLARTPGQKLIEVALDQAFLERFNARSQVCGGDISPVRMPVHPSTFRLGPKSPRIREIEQNLSLLTQELSLGLLSSMLDEIGDSLRKDGWTLAFQSVDDPVYLQALRGEDRETLFEDLSELDGFIEGILILAAKATPPDVRELLKSRRLCHGLLFNDEPEYQPKPLSKHDTDLKNERIREILADCLSNPVRSASDLLLELELIDKLAYCWLATKSIRGVLIELKLRNGQTQRKVFPFGKTPGAYRQDALYQFFFGIADEELQGQVLSVLLHLIGRNKRIIPSLSKRILFAG